MKGRNPFRRRRIELPQQLAAIRARFSDFDCIINDGQLVCRGPIQPTPINNIYVVRIEYRLGGLPRVYVEHPPLRRRSEDEPIPHTYSGPRPCLFYPKDREWRSTMRIANTIMPWLAAWLAFYEIWLATGQWLGEGTHPRQDKTNGS